ncbi:class F sortase [Parafrankia sp. FMc2]|uniref:class F sortase n=1 Tax=Parafrankia sp. FMc2 TaxID=3233196 RepID=UPI0034D398C3
MRRGTAGPQPARMTFSRLLLVAGVVLIAGSGFRLADVGSDRPSDTERVAISDLGTAAGKAGAPAVPGGSGATPVPTLPPVVVTDPTRLRIPVIGLDAPIIRLGLNADGTLDVPKKWQDVGWYDKGPAPGALGPSVLVGHYDSTSGPAAFYRLRALRPGDQIEVASPTGLTTTFTVDRTEDVTKTEFPTERVYGPVNRPELRLITCSGAFDDNTNHYLSNLIVYAHANNPPAPAAAGVPGAPGAPGAPGTAGTPSVPTGTVSPAVPGATTPVPAVPGPAAATPSAPPPAQPAQGAQGGPGAPAASAAAPPARAVPPVPPPA